VGTTSLEKLLQAGADQDLSLLQVLSQATDVGLTGKARTSVEEFRVWMGELATRVEEMTIPDILEEILDKSGYRKWLREDENRVEAQARLENIDELINVTSEFQQNAEDKSLSAFLSEVSLLSDQDAYAEGTETVTLMTLHSAKGLEFPVVFLVGLEDGTFPHSRSLEKEEEMEEERRLCYVGMTRAMEKLYLTSASAREMHGITERRIASRFLSEVPPHLVEALKVDYETPLAPAFGTGRMRSALQARPAPKEKKYINDPVPPMSIAAGDRVRHPSFGLGNVKTADRGFAVVVFDTGGEKTLKAEFLKSVTPGAPVVEPPAPKGDVRSGPLQVGDRVLHSRYGNGVVKALMGEDCTVIFGGIAMQMAQPEAARLRF
jgi:DNA helicase-2/ATP-dependent DNA helicase PcrA